MAQEEFIKQFHALIESITPQQRDALAEFRDCLVRAVGIFKQSGLEAEPLKIELAMVNRKLGELDSLEVVDSVR